MMQHDITQSRKNRIQSFAFVIAASVSVCLAVCFAVSSLAGFGPSGEIQLAGRINPNDAPMASLVRLPGIGISRAAAIVAYRQDFSEKDSNGPAFQDCNDLRKVKGIGPKTTQNISQYLKFE